MRHAVKGRTSFVPALWNRRLQRIMAQSFSPAVVLWGLIHTPGIAQSTAEPGRVVVCLDNGTAKLYSADVAYEHQPTRDTEANCMSVVHMVL